MGDIKSMKRIAELAAGINSLLSHITTCIISKFPGKENGSTLDRARMESATGSGVQLLTNPPN